MKIIQLKNLTATYGHHKAIDNINIDISENEYICLIGENGSRKKHTNKEYARTVK